MSTISFLGTKQHTKIINYTLIQSGTVFREHSNGNKPATVSKKMRALKRLFQLAVERKQLSENPLRYVRSPKWTKRTIEIFDDGDCQHILKVAREFRQESTLRWDLLIYIALTTGMRRGELLNLVWADVDFEAKTVEASPKGDTREAWPWLIKDTDRRTLPLTNEAVSLLAEHQSRQPEKFPYVFVPECRYDRIQELRKQSTWTLSDSRLKVINNFDRKFKKLLKRAHVKRGRFHDLRTTALTSWVVNGMGEYDLMRLAGHGDFNTTHRFYLAVTRELQDKARQVISKSMGRNLARIWHAPTFASKNV
jgi:integrase